MLLPKQKRPVWVDDLQTLELQTEQLTSIPLLGYITAGLPIERIEQEGERVSVPLNMVKRNSYALKVRGHSMIDDNKKKFIRYMAMKLAL